MAKQITPMMQQYYDVKTQYSDCILFFRLGDFYEMFEDDAKVASEILDITLTARGKDENKIPMCGVPYHSAESYIAKLTSKGKKVAICEQVGEVDGPGIVERKVIRVVTPGTNISHFSLDNKVNQFVAGVSESKGEYGIAFCDVSTGELLTGKASSLSELASMLSAYSPKELVSDPKLAENPKIYEMAFQHDIGVSAYQTEDSEKYLTSHFQTKTLNPFGIAKDELLIEATASALQYLESVLKTDLRNVKRLSLLTSDESFDLDHTTIYNLEIFHTIRDFDRKNSLLGVIDKTVTANGGRLLRRWIIRPLKDLELLQDRLNIVHAFHKMSDLSDLRQLLSKTHDLERVVSRLSLGYGNPRDLIQIQNTLAVIPEINHILPQSVNRVQELNELRDLIKNSIKEEPPISKRDAGIFVDGYNKEVDALRVLLREGKDFIANLKQREIERTGITNMKIGFNKVFGYYIEVSKGKVDLVPEDYIRKQTLTNSERYITPELKEYEDKVLHAEDNLKLLEEKLFDELVIEVLKYSDDLYLVAKTLGSKDVSSSLAYLAKENRYSKPELHKGIDINIKSGRHPVLESIMPRGAFVPNDIDIDAAKVKLITGPNMGGKSTYLRQTAIIVLLAQIGAFVPAEKAEIGLVDQIFSRVGAADNLAKGLSTFMVEMEETAYILRQATDRSLLILDELGRGTSTYDGVSIAWSVLEYIHDKLDARTLFATHYHELIQVVESLKNAENLSVSVEEDTNGEPIFLHQIQPGAIDRSYGVHVAKIAGLPTEVLERSNQILFDLEEDRDSSIPQEIAKKRDHQPISNYQPPTLFIMEDKEDDVTKEIEDLDINSMTPLEALQKLQELKEKTS